MPGNRKTKKPAPKKPRMTRMSGRSNGRRNDNANSNENINSNRVQGIVDVINPSNTENNNRIVTPRQVTRGTARIIEDNAVVHMTTEGQDSEFIDQHSSDSMDSGDDQRNVNHRGSNNNAAIAGGEAIRRPLEDGECDDEIVNVGGDRPSGVKRSRNAIGDGGADGVEDLKSYVDQKFSALAKMVELERELSERNRELDLLKAKGKQNEKGQHDDLNGSHSELTIYRNAVEKSKRGSSSSEELIDTSDELVEKDEDYEDGGMYVDNMVRFNSEMHDFDISEREMERAKEIQRDRRRDNDGRRSRGYNGDRPGTSYGERRDYQYDDGYRSMPAPPKRDLVEEKSKRIVNEAEAAKARIYEVPGEFCDDDEMLQSRDNDYSNYSNQQEQFIKRFRARVSTAEMDEDYKMVAAHIDHKTRIQILNHEYIDFAKLLPRTRLGGMPHDDENQFMQIVNRGGTAGFMTMSDRGGGNITSYGKWEQAFRVFSDIYTNQYPSRATELIQYNHTIHTASQSYIWDNVYMYDIEVRKHMSNHPSRNWGGHPKHGLDNLHKG